MKVVFICGSLCFGADGVGDYTRRLGIELIQKGHQASIIALHDQDAIEEINEFQRVGETGIRCLRIPYKTSDKKRFLSAKEFLNAENPDHVSLQYVPFAFHLKGLPFNLANELVKVGKGKKWQIMFHELWVGTEDGHFLKMKIFAFLQKYIIKRMLEVISPSVIHTHLPIYKHQLNKLGWNTSDLSLFSNIELKRLKEAEQGNILRACFFSQIGTSNEIINFLSTISKEIIAKKLKFEILLIGGSEEKMKAFKQSIEFLLPADTTIKHTGFLSAEDVSIHLQKCQFGITPIPRHALGKSGSVAAFISHSLPVAAPNTDKRYLNSVMSFLDPSLQSSVILSPNLSSLEKAKQATAIAKKKINLSKIASKFLSDLK